MKRVGRPAGLFFLVALGGVFSLYGAPVASTADEAGLEHGAFSLVYDRSRTEPSVRVSGTSSISVPVSGGSSAVFNQSNADVSLTRTAEIVGVRLTGRPSSLRYSVFLGQPRDFEVEFASGSETNRLESTDRGITYGFGLSGSFLPSSIASVGVAWDLQFRQSRLDFERFVSALGTAGSNLRLVEDEIQGAVTASKRFGEVSPYAGLKLARWITRLEDRSTGEQLRGYKDGVSVVIGFEWTPVAGEAGFLEASFLDEESISANWGFRF